MTFFSQVELAFSNRVPELDGLVHGTRDDLTIVGREGHRENRIVVADKATGGGARVQIPQTERLIPRGGQGELAVG